MTIEKRKRRLGWHTLDYHVKEQCGKSLRDLTKDELITLLFGNRDNDYTSNFIVKCYDNYSKRTIWNRLNMLWVYPIFLMLLPFQYIITGDTGVNRNTKIGRIVDWLVKFE